MKFNLTAADWDKIARNEKLRSFLESFGVKFRFCDIVEEFEFDYDENCTHRGDDCIVIEFNTIEGLITFTQRFGKIVIYPQYDTTELNEIKVYNDYLE